MRLNWLNKILIVVLVLPIFGALCAFDSKGTLYRYKNKQGTTVINDSVPPEYSKNGYEILNERGQLVEVVPRQLSDDEIKNLSSDEARRQHRKKEEEKLRAWDENLLRRYSDVVDIEAARDRQIKELQIRLSILNGNVLATKSKIERLRSKAADMERDNRKVPASLMENVQQHTVEIERAEVSIENRQKEIEDIKALYRKDIERFRYLLEVKGYRRR